jgi:hypothetical protein
MTGGVLRIAAARQRQIEEKGYTPERDRLYVHQELLAAAICYAHNCGQFKGGAPRNWPWRAEYWKPTPGDAINDLAKAGALIAAEIDRLEQQL